MSRLNSLLRILTLRCEAASELSSRELDESLPRSDRAALLCHLVACRSCQRFRKQIYLIREALRLRERTLVEDDTSEGTLSAEARTRITMAIREAGRDDAGHETGSP